MSYLHIPSTVSRTITIWKAARNAKEKAKYKIGCTARKGFTGLGQINGTTKIGYCLVQSKKIIFQWLGGDLAQQLSWKKIILVRSSKSVRPSPDIQT